MATITSRKRRDGSTAHMAQIVIKRKGAVVHRENKTFDRKQDAYAWAAGREKELQAPGGLDTAVNGAKTLGDAIRKYLDTAQYGDTSEWVLEKLMEYPIARKPCEKIGSTDIIELMTELGKTVTPQTVESYVSRLTPVFKLAKPAWGYPLDKHEFLAARDVGRQLGLTRQSNRRDRRPTLDELQKLMQYFYNRCIRTPRAVPMHVLTAFAIFSARRESEILRIRHEDFEPEHKRVLVRAMKHPTKRKGHDVWCTLTDEAVSIIQAMPKVADEIFPYSIHSVKRAWRDACILLGIEDLHFHDLRHEGVSRLFELGWDIPYVATVSGHQSWSNLKRYSHIRQRGDKYENWEWLRVVTNKETANDNVQARIVGTGTCTGIDCMGDQRVRLPQGS